MAKCAICHGRKGKRKCKAEADAFVCSLCCGQSRTADRCGGCSFYKDPSENRNYRQVPSYTTKMMSDSYGLQDIANTVEAILCDFAQKYPDFTDRSAMELLERAFDRYHFSVSDLSFSDAAAQNRFETMMQLIKTDLPDTPNAERIKVMATIYRSIQRRTAGGREYLDFVLRYVGERVAPGARVLRL